MKKKAYLKPNMKSLQLGDVMQSIAPGTGTPPDEGDAKYFEEEDNFSDNTSTDIWDE